MMPEDLIRRIFVMRRMKSFFGVLAIVFSFALPGLFVSTGGSLPGETPLTKLDIVFTNKSGNDEPLKLDIQQSDINDILEVKEDGKPQKIETFESIDEPLQILVLIDYSQFAVEMSYYSQGEVWEGPIALIRKLKEDDWVGIMLYDIKTEPWLDFTRDKGKTESYIGMLARENPMFSESNISDAVWDVLERLGKDEEHRFAVVMISTGFDTFSKKKFDDVVRRAENSRVVFYPVSIGGNLRVNGLEDYYSNGYGDNMQFLQADQRLRRLAEATGGKAFFPRFAGQFHEIFDEITSRLLTQYTIGYRPTNADFNGEKRKIEIKLKKGFDVNLDGRIDKKDKMEISYKKEYFPGMFFD